MYSNIVYIMAIAITADPRYKFYMHFNNTAKNKEYFLIKTRYNLYHTFLLPPAYFPTQMGVELPYY